MNNQQEQNNMFTTGSIFNNIDSNMFITNENPIESNHKADKQTCINDLDSSLILENVDKTAKNRVVKIDLKLKTLEKTLYRISEELKLLELFNLASDKDKRAELIRIKSTIERQIEDLKLEKRKFGLFYILSSYTNNKLSYEIFLKYFNIVYNFVKKYSGYIIDNKKIINIINMVKR